MCVANLGSIALERFRDARTAKRPAEELASHLAEAARLYKQAFDVLPAIAVRERGMVHSALGAIYNDAGDTDRAHHLYRQSIQYADKTGDIFLAGKMRYEFAFALWQRDRPDARAYAEAALANFRTFGDRAANDIQIVEGLIAQIDQDIAEEAGGV